MEVTRRLDLPAVVAQRTCFLFGPRQCGKSWLARRAFPDAHYFDLLSSDTFLRLSRDPGYLAETCGDGRPVVIDEIQKLPLLLDEVHRLIEERGTRFLLTGSSARKLRRQGVNLLGGRGRLRRLRPFSAAELGDNFSLERALNHGLLPGVWFSAAPDDDLNAYVKLYLEQEIIAEGATRNLPAFSRFLEVAALTSGEQIDYAQISRDAQVPRTTVQEYFRILVETLLADEVPVWRRGKSRKTVETAKFYLFDNGVARALQGRRSYAPGSAEYGHALESWVYHELRCWLDCHRPEGKISYWRTRGGTEVDFVVDDRAAVEVKATKNVSRGDLRGLKAIAEEGDFARRVVVCAEPRPRLVDGIDILPWRDFLKRAGEILA